MSYQKYLELRKSYPCFVYEGFTLTESKQNFEVLFDYTLQGEKETIPLKHRFSIEKNFAVSNCDRDLINNAAFHIGLAETINYWKAICSPKLVIKPFKLTTDQLSFWSKLFYNGLGEFLYRNDIYSHIKAEEFIDIVCDPNAPVLPKPMETGLEGSLIPVGGGKDSIVTLELLQKDFGINEVFLLDPRQAAIDSSICAGYDREKSLVCHRVFDPTLFEFNKKGYLNGHIPYSAILAFCALLSALLKGRRNIVLSNEGSANEPTVPDTAVNHQYSKTFEFEKDFSDYIHANITPSVDYFSLLRPWSEARITREFVKYTKYYDIFRSCNRGSKENKWCGACPKCLFVFVLLASEIGIDKASDIFGSRVLENESLIPVLDELTGISPVKPFECVGTVAETVRALDSLLSAFAAGGHLPVLLQHFGENREKVGDHEVVLVDSSSPNLLPDKFKKIVLGE